MLHLFFFPKVNKVKMESNEIFAQQSMSSLSTSLMEHDMINLVDDTDDKVVVTEKNYLPTVSSISLVSTVLLLSSISSTSSELSINSPSPFYNINVIL